MHILIAGATGLLGRAVSRELRRQGHQVVALSHTFSGDPRVIPWEPHAGRLEVKLLESFDVAINLAGANIGEGRWSEERKRAFYDSRVKSTQLLAEALASLERPPSVLISASAVGYYGNRGDEVLTEESGPGDDFMGKLCAAWEAVAEPARARGIRVVHTRTGVVLTKRGGALPRMMTPFRFGVGGPLGSGRQWWSWISLDDLVGVMQFLMTAPTASGPVNVVSPQPVRNKEFAKTLGKVMRRPAIFPAPAFMLRLILGAERADEILLSSQRVNSAKLQRLGYAFKLPELEPALRNALA